MKSRLRIAALLVVLVVTSLWPTGALATSPWSIYQAAQAAEQAGDWTRATTLYQ
jgi:hypothetical protein